MNEELYFMFLVAGAADNTTCQLNRRETLKPATVNGLCLTEDLEVPPHVLNR